MKKYSILCPTRDRSDRAKRYIESVLRTAKHPGRVEILLYVDNDDPSVEKYWVMTAGFVNVHLTVGEPISVSKSWNILAEQCIGDVLMMGNDDLVHESKNWDIRFDEETAKFPDDIYCIWANDKHKKETLCTFPTVSRKWYEIVGYFAPGIFEFFFNDTWVQDIGRRVGRLHYVEDVIIEHQHFSYGYGKDATTLKHRSGHGAGQSNRDQATFKANEHLRVEAAERLRVVME